MKIKLLLDSRQLFPNQNSKVDLSLLGNWTLNTLLITLSRLNHLVIPRIKEEKGLNNCFQIWKKITFSDKNIADRILLNALNKNTGHTGLMFQEAVFFSRISNLFAIKQILLSRDSFPTESKNFGEQDLISFLHFYAQCNYSVNDFEESRHHGCLTGFDSMAFRNLPQFIFNSHITPTQSFFQLVHDRFYSTLNFHEVNVAIEMYLENSELSIQEFLKHYLGGLFHYTRNQGNPELIQVEEGSKNESAVRVFNFLSGWNNILNAHDLDFSSIKKFPLFKLGSNKYVVLDSDFLIQKFHSSIYNDCFFDYLEPQGKKIKWFNSHHGKVFEKIISERLNSIFSKQRNCIIRFGDSLNKDAFNNQLQNIEIADYYAHRKNKIFIAEMKTSMLTVDQQSGASESFINTTSADFFKFLKKFGLKQLAEHVNHVFENPTYFEKKLRKDITVYPCIVVTEKALTQSILLQQLRIKFYEILFNYKSVDYARVKPLIILTDLDIYRFEASGSTNLIWYLLEKNIRETEFDLVSNSFELTLNRFGLKEKKRDLTLAIKAGYE